MTNYRYRSPQPEDRYLAVMVWLAGLFAVLTLVSCASVPLKQRISQGHQTVRAALVILDDAERQLCIPAPTQPNHCTSAAAASVGLTDAKHQAISLKLADAFQVDVKVGAAIIAWKAGDPMPTDLPTLLADANATLAVAQSLTPNNGLVSKVTDWVTRLTALTSLFK